MIVTCAYPGCEEVLQAHNTTGFCFKYHRHEGEKALRRLLGRPHRSGAEAWLTTVGLTNSADPNVAVLRSVATELDDLEDGAYPDLNAKQKLDVAHRTRSSIAAIRKALQAEVDRADSADRRRRHQLLFAGIAAEALGFLDVSLLSEALREQVAAEMKEHHNITLDVFEPVEGAQ